MRKILFLLALICIEKAVQAQYVYTIKADSVKITNSCDTAELIIENRTQNVPGFLYNKGRGRTEFRRAVKLDDSTIVLGGDTIVIIGGTTANNGLSMEGKNVQLGQPVGVAGNPAAFNADREIPLNGFKLSVLNGSSGFGTNSPASKVDIKTDSLGASQTNTSGLLLSNTTAAASGGQEISPAIRWRGNGWRTSTPAMSMPVDFRAYVLPIQSTAVPAGTWILETAINNAAYATKLSVSSDARAAEFMANGLRISEGGIHLGGGVPSQRNFSWGGGEFVIGSSSTLLTPRNVLTFSGTEKPTSGTTNFTRWFSAFSPTSGTAVGNVLAIEPAINQSGGANGTTRGLFINPTLTSAADFRSIETVRGNAIFGSTSGNVLIGTSVDSGFKLDVTGNVRGTGSLELSTASEGVILKSPNGTRYKVTVADDGSLTTSAL